MGLINWIRRVSVRSRLLAALLLISLAPIAIAGALAHGSYAGAAEAKLAEAAAQTARLVDGAFTKEMARYASFIDAVSVTQEVQDALSLGYWGGAARRAMTNMPLPGGDLIGVVICGADGRAVYDNGWLRVSGGDFLRLEGEADETSPVDMLGRADVYGGGSLVLGRKIYRFPDGRRHIGYIFVFLRDSLPAAGLFDGVSIGGGGVELLSNRGEKLAGGGTEEDSLLVSHKSAKYGSRIILTIPKSYIDEEIGKGTPMFAAVSALSAGGAVLIFLHIANIEKNAKVREEEARRRRELELTALRYQINPHFLFNTLDSLKWIVAINGAPDSVGDGLVALSGLLRGVLSRKDEMLPLSDELDILAHYFSIQNIRYGGCFEVIYDIDEEALTCPVPRLILQPLAENAILHGQYDDGRRVCITVRCKAAESGCVLEIADDGCGFDVRSAMDKTDGRFSGIGLSNVDERLRLYYGGGLEISSNPGAGTVCRAVIPKIKSKRGGGKGD